MLASEDEALTSVAIDRARPFAPLRRFLGAVRVRLVLRAWLWSAVLLVDLLLLLLLVGLPPRVLASSGTRYSYLTVAGLAVMMAIAVIVRRLVVWPGDREVARVVARGDAAVGDSLLTAVELENQASGIQRGSPLLVALHREATSRRIAGARPARLVPWSPLLPLVRLGSMLAVTVGLVSWLEPGRLSQFFSALLATPGEVAALVAGGKTAGATIAQLRLRYDYPPYSGLPPRVVEGATGDIRALRGTEITFEAIADRAITAGWIRLDSGATVAFDVRDGRDVSTRLVIHEHTRWHAELQERDGGVSIDPFSHAITVEDDAFPEVQLVAPATDLELDELRELEIVWRASDDFGLAEANLVIDRAGSETRTKLEIDRGSRSHSGSVTALELKLALAPGDDIGFYVEVIDTDTVSGPKRGVSETRHLRVRSAEEAHSELLMALARLLDDLLASLAMVLPMPAPQPLNARATVDFEQALGERLGVHVAALDEILRGLWTDPLGSESTYERVAEMRVRLEGLKAEKTSFLTREAPALRRPLGDPALVAELLRLRTQETAELETDALVLDDLVHRERVDELERLADALLRDQERLTALLEEYARTGDAATKSEIDRLMRHMERSLGDLEARMAELGEGGGPDEFLNLGRLREAMGKSAGESLAEMRASLEGGDTDAAGARARDLTASLRGALAMLQRGVRPGSGAVGDTRLFDQANQLAERLTALVAAEGKLIDSTDHVKRQIESRRFAKLGDPAELFARERERAAEIARLTRAAQRVIDEDPALAERRRIVDQLVQAGAEGRRRLLEGASMEELDRRQGEIFELRSKLAGLGRVDVLAAREDLEQAARAADTAAMALGARSLADALPAMQELTMLLSQAQERLEPAGASPPGADGAAVPPEMQGDDGAGARAAAAAPSGRAVRESAELLKDLRALDSLLRRPAGADASAIEAKSLEEFERRQRALETETHELDALALKLGDEVPNMPPELRESLEQAADYMNLAARALNEHDAKAGLHNEREAKARLEQASRSAEAAAGSCQNPGGSGSKPSGAQLAFIPEGVGGEPRFRRQGDGGSDRRQGGTRGYAAEKVAIPDGADARAPEAFRKDLLEAMKEPRPEGYAERIDLYYRRLVQ